MLGATDFHEDNFIVDGEYPVPIDLETLCSVSLTPGKQLYGMQKLPDIWSKENVSFTMMLPRWYGASATGPEAVVASAIAGRDADQVWPIIKPVFENLGTDQLAMKLEYKKLLASDSQPTLKNSPIDPWQYMEQVLEGFNTTYSTILTHRHQLTCDNGPLQPLSQLQTRVILRDTNYYVDMLFWSTAPDNLISGAAYDVALEYVCGAPLETESDPQGFGFCDDEKAQFWRRNVPYFTGMTNSRFLHLDNGREIGPLKDVSGFEYVKTQLMTQFSEKDRQWQCHTIDRALTMSKPIKHHKAQNISEDPEQITSLESQALTKIKSFSKQLQDAAIPSENGPQWLSLGRWSQSQFPQIGLPLPWVPFGATGAAIFLANTAKRFNEGKSYELATQATKNTAGMTLRYQKDLALHLDGLFGSGLVLYALLVCHKHFHDEEYLRLASAIIEQISERDCKTITRPDLRC